jgi:hypothetical protein
MSVELRVERRLWRALRWLAAPKKPRRTPSGSTTLARQQRVIMLSIAGVLALLFLLYFLTFQAVFLVVLAVAVLASVLAIVLGSMGYLWWAAGAGRPVLVVDGDLVRGRIRPAFRADIGDWWDFSLPAARLAGVRLERAGQPAQRWTIALDLPDDVRNTLLSRSDCSWYAHRWQSNYGSPAAWQAGRLLRRTGRQDRVRALVAGVDAARTGGAQPARPE